MAKGLPEHCPACGRYPSTSIGRSAWECICPCGTRGLGHTKAKAVKAYKAACRARAKELARAAKRKRKS